jgi:hypothetical protein
VSNVSGWIYFLLPCKQLHVQNFLLLHSGCSSVLPLFYEIQDDWNRDLLFAIRSTHTLLHVPCIETHYWWLLDFQ